MKRRTFVKIIFPTIFIPKLIVPVWKVLKLVPTHVFGTICLPQIKRVFPTFPVHDFISVQPMSLPIEETFYMDFVTTSKGDDNWLDVKTPTIHPNNNSIIDDSDWLSMRE